MIKMAVAFIFVSFILVLVLLVFSFIIQLYFLMMISSMGMIVLGVTSLASGIRGIDDILTLGLGIIFICFGAYIFIKGSIEKMEIFEIPRITW